MKIKGVIKDVIYNKNGFAIFKIEPEEESKSNIPQDAFSEWDTTIKILWWLWWDLELLVNYKVEVEWKFQNVSMKYYKEYEAKIEFKMISIDIIDTLTSKSWLIAYITRYLSGVWEVLAENMIDYFWIDNFVYELDKENAIEELLKIKWIWEIKAKEIKKDWDANKEVRNILIDLSSLWLSVNKSLSILKEWWASYKSILEEDPYRLTEINGIWFSLADEVARKYLNMDKKDHRRYASIIEYLLKEISKSNWDSLISKTLILERIKSFISNEEGFENEDIAEIMSVWISKAVELKKIIEINPEIFVLKKYFFLEIWIAKKIKELLEYKPDSSKFKTAIEKDEKATLNKEPLCLNEAQLEAKKNILNKWISLLLGGAWTWKTFTVWNIIKTLDETKTNYHIIAPTNKAVARILEINPKAKVSTIHKLIGITPWVKPTYNEDNPLPYDKILVDESSMIDNEVAAILLNAIDTKRTTLTFIWDPQQLPPVSIWSFFYDIIHSGVLDDNISFLKVVERTWDAKYDEVKKTIDNFIEVKNWVHNIVANSLRILNKELPLNTNYDCINIFSENDLKWPDLEKDVKEKIQQLYTKLRLSNIDYNKDFQIYIPQYSTELWINKINTFISDFINPNQKILIEWNMTSFKINDKVFYNNTNNDLELTKWDVGYITNISPETKSIEVQFYNKEEPIELSSEDIKDLWLWYALTVHKAQWTEIKYGCILLTTSFYMLLTNELLYTAYTRCKEKVFLLWTQKAYETALKTYLKQRNTYLFHLLNGTENENIFTLVNRRNFWVSDKEIKQVEMELSKYLEKTEYKLYKISYARVQSNSYFKYIFTSKEYAKQMNIYDDLEITDTQLEELKNDENIYFVKIKKNSNKDVSIKDLEYNKELVKWRNIVITINSFNKDVSIIYNK